MGAPRHTLFVQLDLPGSSRPDGLSGGSIVLLWGGAVLAVAAASALSKALVLTLVGLAWTGGLALGVVRHLRVRRRRDAWMQAFRDNEPALVEALSRLGLAEAREAGRSVGTWLLLAEQGRPIGKWLVERLRATNLAFTEGIDLVLREQAAATAYDDG